MEKELIIDGQLFLYGDVGDMWGDGTGFSAMAVIKALSGMRGDITIRLNSGGGLVMEGIAIYNAIKAYPGGAVTMQCDGIAASAASLIFMAAAPGKRIMGAGTMLMIHDPSGVTIGTAADHENTAEVLHRMADSFAAIYASASGKKEAEVRQIMTDETWFTAAEAVAAGFADGLIENNSAAKATALVEPAKFDYMIYRNAPQNVKAAQRALPTATAARAALTPENTMTPEQIAAKAAADKLIADATAAATLITSEATAGTEAAKATAKVTADKLVADATAAAAVIVADAKTAATASADVTKQILDRCNTAKLTVAQSLEIIGKAAGNLVKAQDFIIDAVAAAASDQTHRPAHVTADARDKLIEGVTKGLLFRAGQKGGERNEFTGLTLRETAREVLVRNGSTAKFSDPMLMIAAAFRPTMAGPGLHSTSDFIEILANIAEKSLLKGYEEAAETFQIWTSKGNLQDFRATKRVSLNAFPGLAEVPEGGEYTYGTIGDRGVAAILATYGKRFAITRQAIINDDLGQFTRVPAFMGRAAKRTVADLAYASITVDANTAPDGVALFHANHNNYIASGAAPTAITFSAAQTKMVLQQDPSGNSTGGLNIRPAFILVPVELEATAKILMASANDPAATTPNVVNPVQGLATVVSDARLSTKSAKEWYLAANPNQFDTVEVAYLNGNENPTLEQRDGWDVDGVEFKVRLDAAVTVLDYKGLVKNNGE